MGIDIEIYVEGTCTDEELEAAERYMMTRVPGLSWNPEITRTILQRTHLLEERIEIDSGDRLYSQGYERGNWPKIYGGIRAMQGAFPERKVFYMGDVSEYGMECTPEFLEDLWQHWLGPNGNAYHERRQG